MLNPEEQAPDEFKTALSGIKAGVSKEFLAEFDQWAAAMKPEPGKPKQVLDPFIEDTLTDLEDLGKLAVATPGYAASKLGLIGKKPTEVENREYNRLLGQNVGNLLLYPTKGVRTGVSAATVWTGLGKSYLDFAKRLRAAGPLINFQGDK